MSQKNIHQVIVCTATNMLNVFNVTSDMNTVEREHQIKDIFHWNIFKSSFYTELSLKNQIRQRYTHKHKLYQFQEENVKKIKKKKNAHVIWNNSASKSISYLKTREQIKNHEEVNMNKKLSCNKSTLLNVSIQVSKNHTYLVLSSVFPSIKNNTSYIMYDPFQKETF